MREIEAEKLKDLIEYKSSMKLSAFAWNILSTMDAENRQLLGDPFVKSVDSIGANIAEGFNHVNNDVKINFYINSKAALSEAIDHWSELMLKRNVISKVTFNVLKELEKPLKAKLKSRISSTIKN